MGRSGIRNIVLGIVFVAVGILLRDWFVDWGASFLFYVIIAAGLLLGVYGLFQFNSERGKPEEQRLKEKKDLTREVFLKTLARVSYADTNINPVEVSTICKVYKEVTGKKVDEVTVRVAARGDVHETKAFHKYLRGVRDKLDHADKMTIMKGVVRVIEADGKRAVGEVRFFNEVAKELKLNPGDLLELTK